MAGQLNYNKIFLFGCAGKIARGCPGSSHCVFRLLFLSFALHNSDSSTTCYANWQSTFATGRQQRLLISRGSAENWADLFLLGCCWNVNLAGELFWNLEKGMCGGTLASKLIAKEGCVMRKVTYGRYQWILFYKICYGKEYFR